MTPCGKNGYPSRRIAEAVVRDRMRQNRTLYLRVYRCPDCGLFHLTHVPDLFEDAR